MGMGNRGDDPVETDLRAIARRRNGVTLQHWLALATAITIGAATVLGAVALRAPAAAFPAILAAAATVSVGAWVYAGHRIRSAWLTWQDAAALADHLAALDGRLSTWAGDPQRVAASRLGALLREQILRARPRWNASAIIPHRLSRALLLIPAMLVISGASMFLARPAHRPALSFPTAMTDGAAQAFVKHSQTGQRDGATTAGAEMHGQAGASGSAGTARTGDAQTLPGSDAGPHGSGEGQPSGDGAAPPHAAERLRDAIRAAFGADPAPGEQAKGSRGSQDPTRPGAVTLAKDSGG